MAPTPILVPISPATDDMLTIAPRPCASIWRISYFMHRNTPVRLIASTSSQTVSS